MFGPALEVVAGSLPAVVVAMAGFDGAAVAAAAGDEFPTWRVVLGLLGGLALFLFGMDVLTKGLRKLASGRMRRMLAGMTANRFTGFLSGFFVTAGLQSSSVTTVLVIGFVSAGLIAFAQTIGIVAGANVGTAVTAHIIAFRVAEYAPLLLVFGYVLTLFRPRRVPYRVGQIVIGLGLLFLGMHAMSEGMAPLRDVPAFRDAMVTFENPWLALLVGAVFTAVIQASAAAIAILITLVVQDLISVPTAIAMLIGVNIGTCSTTLLASVGKQRDALRVASVHLVFNVAGAIIWVPMLGVLVDVSWVIIPGSDAARAIANAHAVFNLSTAVLFLLITPWVAALIMRVLPERPDTRGIVPKHLQDELLAAPPMALEAARREIVRYGRKVVFNLRRAFEPIVGNEHQTSLEQVWQYDERLDRLHVQIVKYLSRIGEEELSTEESRIVSELMDVVNSLAQISDIVVGDLVRLGYERGEKGLEPSAKTTEILRAFHDLVVEAIEVAVEAVETLDTAAGQTVRIHKDHVNSVADRAAEHLQQRLTARAPRRMDTYSFETKLVEHLRRIYYFAKRIGDTIEEIAPDFPGRAARRATMRTGAVEAAALATEPAATEERVVEDDLLAEEQAKGDTEEQARRRTERISEIETQIDEGAMSRDSIHNVAPSRKDGHPHKAPENEAAETLTDLDNEQVREDDEGKP